jgi:hypothetical protein
MIDKPEPRRFPPPWSVERRAAAKLLSCDRGLLTGPSRSYGLCNSCELNSANSS